MYIDRYVCICIHTHVHTYKHTNIHALWSIHSCLLALLVQLVNYLSTPATFHVPSRDGSENAPQDAPAAAQHTTYTRHLEP